MTSVQIHGLISTFLVPLAATLLALTLVWRPWKRDRLTPRAPVPIALAFGLLCVEIAVRGWTARWGELGGVLEGGPGERLGALWRGIGPAVWPVDATRRLPHFGLMALAGAGVIALLGESAAGKIAAARWGVRLLVCGAVGFLLAWPLHPHAVGSWDVVWWTLGSATLGAAVWAWWGAALAERPGATVPLTMSGVVGGFGLVLLGVGVATVGQVAGAFANCLLVVAVLAWRRPDCVESRAAAAVPAVTVVGLVLVGQLYSDAPRPLAIALAGAGCLVVGLVRLPVVGRLRPVVGGSIQVGVVGLVMGGAVAGAFLLPEPGAGDDAADESPGYGSWDSIGGGDDDPDEARLDGGRILEDDGDASPE